MLNQNYHELFDIDVRNEIAKLISITQLELRALYVAGYKTKYKLDNNGKEIRDVIVLVDPAEQECNISFIRRLIRSLREHFKENEHLQIRT